MKNSYFLIFAIIISACSNNKPTENIIQNNGTTDYTEILIKPELKGIIDSANVDGSILIYDVAKKVFYSNKFKRNFKGHLPASTFKIPNSIIALETAVVENDSTMFKWNGEKRRLKIWEQDLTFKEAFQYSCVPCYQEIARNIGVKRMNEFLDTFYYGNMEVDSSNIDLFWLEGGSKISQIQQIRFLRNFYNSKLPISKRTEKIMKRIMVIEENEFYILSGKTGWSIRDGNNNGWFVGYIEIGENVYFFATNISPHEKFNMDMFAKIRSQITIEALIQLNIINKI